MKSTNENAPAMNRGIFVGTGEMEAVMPQNDCHEALIAPYVAACLGLLRRKYDRFYLNVIDADDWKLVMEQASGLNPAELRARYLELGGNRDAFRVMLENVGWPSDSWLLDGAPCLLAAMAMRTIPDEQ